MGLSAAANERGDYLIAPLGIELGLWQGSYQIKPNSGCAGGMSKNLL